MGDKNRESAIREYTKFCSDPELLDIYERREKFRLDFNTMLREARAKGLAQGLTEVLTERQAKGLTKGLTEGQVELLFEIIELLFGSMTEEFKAKLRAIDDLANVIRLLTYITTSAQTLYDVERAIS